MARVKGSNVTGAPIELTSAAPVDAKMLVSLKSELYTKATWQAPSAAGANAGKMFCYYGMLVYVGNDSAENNGLYVLQNSGANDANVDALVSSNWVRISQTDTRIDAIETELATKQSESISVSGITATTVEGALAEVSTRLAGAATEGNLEVLGNRITAVEGDVDTVSGKADANAEAIEVVATDVQIVSTAVNTVSGVAIENSADIDAIQTALEGIYTKDETDSAITSAIANAATLEFVVYDGTLAELLQTVGDPKKIYLVTNSGNPNNAKDEYIYSEGKWELIGTTATDLSKYFTKDETQSAINTTVAGVSAGLQSDIEANATDINEINTVSIPAITESIDEVAGEVDLVAADVEEVSGKADANAADIKEIKDTTIPAVEAKVNTVSGKADTNAEAIAGLRTDVDTVSGKADTNAEAIAGLRTDIDTVSGSVNAFNERVDALEDQHDNINSKIDANVVAISALQQADTLKANSDATNINVDYWKTKLDINTLEGSVSANAEAIEAVVADVKYVSGAVDTNAAEIAKKATQTDFIILSGKVDANTAVIDTKASQAEFVTLSGKVYANANAVATKASQTDLNTVSALAEANAAAVATKADAAEVSSTYLKKSGDTQLIIGDGDSLAYTRIRPGEIKIEKNETDQGSFSIDGASFSVVGSDGSSIRFNYSDGFSGTFIDTTIPEEPEDGHIATTGAIKTYVDDQVSAIKTSITTAYIYRGSDTYENIAAKTGAQVGDVWNSTTANGNVPAGTNYAWNGTSWDALGGEVDLSAYATTESVTTALNTAISGVEADINTVSEEVQAVAEGTSDKIAKAGWKAKLGFIESTEVSAYQAQVDWNAYSGVKSIANKPAIAADNNNLSIYVSPYGNELTLDSTCIKICDDTWHAETCAAQNGLNTFAIGGCMVTDSIGMYNIKLYGCNGNVDAVYITLEISFGSITHVIYENYPSATKPSISVEDGKIIFTETCQYQKIVVEHVQWQV